MPYCAAVSGRQRLALIALAAAVAVAAFVIAKPAGDEESSQAGGGSRAGEQSRQPTASRPARPKVERIDIRGGKPRDGVRTITAKTGDTVRLLVTSDTPDEVHLHGYDITREPRPDNPARFRFKATIEGVFEIESHVAEDAGREPLVARLVVAPR